LTRRQSRVLVAAGVVVGLALIAAGRGANRLAPGRVDPALALTAHASVPPEVDSVLRRACFDCHSNDTRWPWYSSIPPGSWLIAHDVDAGRGQLNFSRWGEYNPFDRADMLDKMCDFATKRKMPLWPYRLLHRDARLNDADVAALCRWTDTEATRLVNGGT
jgi:hypothetical protein